MCNPRGHGLARGINRSYRPSTVPKREGSHAFRTFAPYSPFRFPLDTYRRSRYHYSDLQYDTRRKAPVPARGRGRPPRHSDANSRRTRSCACSRRRPARASASPISRRSKAAPVRTSPTRRACCSRGSFKVHPGYLVDDPEGYQTELISDLGAVENKLDLWLINGAEAFPRRPGALRGAANAGAARRFAPLPAAAARDSGNPGPVGPPGGGSEAAGAGAANGPAKNTRRRSQ